MPLVQIARNPQKVDDDEFATVAEQLRKKICQMLSAAQAEEHEVRVFEHYVDARWHSPPELLADVEREARALLPHNGKNFVCTFNRNF